MTYLAPRQGLFAIIILISFFIQTLLLLISSSQQNDELKMQTGERMLVQLIEEVRLPLSSKDKVSLSVLTGRYTSENYVASLTVKDIDGEVLLQTGQAQMLEGDNIEKPVILGDMVIGSVEMTLRKTSNGEIIASQWLFILGSFITHVLIWLLYGYIARPTRAQLAALSRDVQDYLIRQKRLTPAQSSVVASTSNEQTGAGLTIHEALGEYIKSHQDQSESEAEQAANDSMPQSQRASAVIGRVNKGTEHADTQQGSVDVAEQSQPASTEVATDNKPKALVADRDLTVASVQIQFYDPDLLLNTLAFEKSAPYFALCSQLLQRTIEELLKQQILFGIKLKNKPIFDENGATVEFIGTTSHSKVGLAAMMLAKAYIMLNQVTHTKHRELQRFALEVMVGVSDAQSSDKLQQLMANNAEPNQILTLLPVEGLKQLRGLIQLSSLKNPTTVYERDCAYLEGVSDSMMQRLIDVRDGVLLSARG